MSKSNVHPDHYKVAGRDRQDDAAAARQARAMAAKPSSRERPDRMSKGPYFQRPETAASAATRRDAGRATSKASVTPGKKKSSKPRTRRKPAASSRRATGRSAKKNPAGAANRRPPKKR